MTKEWKPRKIKARRWLRCLPGTSVKEIVTLTPSQSSATVELKLGPKPGVLLPSVKDKLTGEPVTSFQVSWEISDSPNRSHSGGQTITQGIKRAIVPPEKYFLLTISASGYKKWIYHHPSDPSRPALIRFNGVKRRNCSWNSSRKLRPTSRYLT
jgi:hypothetical protein